jgi:hypothetical protein
MITRAQLACGSLWLLFGVSGCPVTDDYFIDPDAGEGAAAHGGADPSGGKPSGDGGLSTAGEGGGAARAGTGSVAQGGQNSAGAPPASQEGGAPEATAGAPGAACQPTTERCNGHDDNCNEIVDEQACNSAQLGTTGCSGFVLAASETHGYMLCSGGTTRDYNHAQEACQAQGMRLVWIETEAENEGLSTKVAALVASGTDVWIGANDLATEGRWLWDGGQQFWSGNNSGKPVNGAYVNWMDGAPNNGANTGSGSQEDCAALIGGSPAWGDRSCSNKYGYLCEEHD